MMEDAPETETAFEVVLEPIRRESLWTIAALQGDLTPIHWRDGAVRELGVGERPIVQGSMLIELVLRAFDQSDSLLSGTASLEVRFRRPVFVDDRLAISVGILPDRDEYSVAVKNEEGSTVAEGRVQLAHDEPEI
jgi:acyl dehydratase